MATLIYALAGYGRGHLSRAFATAAALRARGHKVVFCCGGQAEESLLGQGERVISVPALSPSIHANQGSFLRMIANNALTFGFGPDFNRLSDALIKVDPDLLLADFEPFAPAAADMLGIPVVSLNHQQIVTETRYSVPRRYRLSAVLTNAAVRVLTPLRPLHTLVSSFYYPKIKRPLTTTLLPPLLRTEVLGLQSRQEKHILVYFNGAVGLEPFLTKLSKLNARFVVYNAEAAATPINVTLKTPSKEGFLRDLATCAGVVCTAGFNLISEALFLRKPLLVVPNAGLFEQTLNALYVEREGWGRACYDPLPDSKVLAAFVKELPRARQRLEPGNDRLVQRLEAILSQLSPFQLSVTPPSSLSAKGLPS